MPRPASVTMVGPATPRMEAASVPQAGLDSIAWKVPIEGELHAHAYHLALAKEEATASWLLWSLCALALSPGCPPGMFGANCSQPCQCGPGERCHPETGACVCPPGHSGAPCRIGEFLAPHTLTVLRELGPRALTPAFLLGASPMLAPKLTSRAKMSFQVLFPVTQEARSPSP